MLIQRVNRTDAEKIFIICHNVNGATATTGRGQRFVGGTPAEIASADGTQVVNSADAAMASFAGIADQDIPDDGYGRVQAWGFVNSIELSAEADKTVAPVAIGTSFLKGGAVAGTFTSTQTAQALSTMAYKYVSVLNTVNISGGLVYAKGFVRAI
jgi:hypothetical protein